MSDDLDAKIRAAAKILREDKVNVSLKEIREKFAKHFPDDPEPADPNGNPTPPPKKGPEDQNKDTKPKSRWWGDAIEPDAS